MTRDTLATVPRRSIRFVVQGCSLGKILVAATDRGICWLGFGSDDAPLARNLAQEFPFAVIEAAYDDTEMRRWSDTIVRYVDGEAPMPDLPLDVSGSRFQRRVWDALRQIPAGTTVTYGALASSLGMPRGARAVAGACGSNPAAVLVPCHRVVPASGGAGGYRWGEWRKRALLRRDAASSPQREAAMAVTHVAAAR